MTLASVTLWALSNPTTQASVTLWALSNPMTLASVTLWALSNPTTQASVLSGPSVIQRLKLVLIFRPSLNQ